MTNLPSRQALLYDAATRWNRPPLWPDPEDVIEAAVNCLVDGIDSPSLRELAGASPKDSTEEIKDLVEAALRELDLPAPGALPRTKFIAGDGQTVTRLPRDTVRFEVRSTAPEQSGHEVLVYVNDVEMTSIGAGMGMDPFDLLIPENRLVATTVARQVGIARCNCGVYGCGATDVVILREGDAVHWDWELEEPIRGGVTFKADQYDAEVARIGADTSWERPEDTTARYVITGADRERLASMGMRVRWAAVDHADHGLFKVALHLAEADPNSTIPDYQIFLRVPRDGRSPQQVADEMLGILSDDPGNWWASWHPTRLPTSTPPDIAGRRWKLESFGLRASQPRGRLRRLFGRN